MSITYWWLYKNTA